MATLSQSIRLNDGFTPVIKNMYQAIAMTLQGFERMQEATSNSINVSEFEHARNALNNVGAEIRQAEEQQKRFNNQIKQTNGSANNLLGTVKKVVSAYAVLESGKRFIESADQYASAQAKLNLINDGLQTTDELNQEIFDSAGRARGNYIDMLGVVGKLGITASDAFSNNEEIIAFSELMTKSFKVAGASAQEQSAAMYQLTQAMASGRLQGDEFRSILENAPTLAQAIAKEMGVSLGVLKEMSSEGLITSDVIKSALFNSAETINEQFEQMPIKFSEITTRIKDSLFANLQPAFQRFSNFLNSESGERFFVGLGNAIIIAVGFATTFMDVLVWIASVFTNHWSLIAPILFAILTPFLLLKGAALAYNTVLAIQNGLQAISAFRASVSAARQEILAGATIAQAAATTTATGAQIGFNAALMASPLTWALLIIVAIVGVIWLLIKVLNHFGISTDQIVGAVVGYFYALWATIQNMVIYFYNVFGAFTNFFKNVFKDPVGAVKMLFLDLSSNVINFIFKIAEALENVINKIPGFEINITSALEQTLSAIDSAKKTIAAENGVTSFEPVEFKNVSEAYGNGFEVGSDAWNSFSDKFNKNGYMDELFPKENPDIDLDSIAYIDEIGSINDTVDVSSEDLKTMRELAAVKSIQNFVTLTPSVQVQTGDIKNDVDVDDIVAKITESLETEIGASTKEVYDLG